MKLLLDQNLSHRLIQPLSEFFPESNHVGLLGMGESADSDIWQYALNEDYGIVTLDADFHEYSLLKGGPPLVVWLKCGNQPKQVVLEKLLSGRAFIEDAAADPNIWYVEVY